MAVRPLKLLKYKFQQQINVLVHEYQQLNIVMSSHKINPHSRFNIINWVNDVLLLPMTKIQQLGAGNIYCQLLDAGYPQKVPLHKVKWDARTQVDFIHNFKILQSCFDHLGIDKKIQIQKLTKIKYQDNLEFVQWLRNYLHDKIDQKNYQPLKRRNFVKVNLNFAQKKKFNHHHSNSHHLNNKENINTLKHSSICQRSVKHIPEKKKSLGPISVLNLQNEQKKQENFNKCSIILEHAEIVESDYQEETF